MFARFWWLLIRGLSAARCRGHGCRRRQVRGAPPAFAAGALAHIDSCSPIATCWCWRQRASRSRPCPWTEVVGGGVDLGRVSSSGSSSARTAPHIVYWLSFKWASRWPPPWHPLLPLKCPSLIWPALFLKHTKRDVWMRWQMVLHMRVPTLHVIVGPVMVGHSFYIYSTLNEELRNCPPANLKLKYIIKGDNNDLEFTCNSLSNWSKWHTTSLAGIKAMQTDWFSLYSITKPTSYARLPVQNENDSLVDVWLVDSSELHIAVPIQNRTRYKVGEREALVRPWCL